MESNKKEPDRCGEEPLSITARPPNLILGLSVLTVIRLFAMFN